VVAAGRAIRELRGVDALRQGGWNSLKPLLQPHIVQVMGQHTRCESLFYHFRLEDQVPENHLLRLVDKHIDFGFARERLKDSYSDTGRPSAEQESDGGASATLLILSARLSDGDQPVRLKLDLGTNSPFLYNTNGYMVPRGFGGRSVVGGGADGDQKVFVALPPQEVKISSVRLSYVKFMTLAHPQKSSGRGEYDGLLSMDLFRRVFIDHADGYAVLEP